MEVTKLPCKMRATRHAEDKMIERGISRTEAVEAIKKGAKLKRGRRILTRLRGIELVYEARPCNHLVITLYRR